MTIIEVKNDELLGRTNDGVIAVNFYAMQKQIDDLQKENEELKEKIKNYENPKDLTLMFMYCDLKAKDKIKELKERINKAIEYIENNPLYETEYDYDYEENSYLSGIDDEIAKKDLLEILRGEENVKN